MKTLAKDCYSNYRDVVMKKKIMKKMSLIVVFLLLSIAPIGCGKAHFELLKPPEAGSSYKNIQVADVVVTSNEKGQKYDDLNTKFASSAKEIFINSLKDKGIYDIAKGSSTDVFTLESKIDLDYGNRALRYWIGFGAGAGHCVTIMELKDSSGNVKIKTKTKSDLAMGAFGGSMDKTINRNVKIAIEKFVDQL